MSCLMTKPTKRHVHPTKTQINLGIHPVWSESSVSAWRLLGTQSFCWFGMRQLSCMIMLLGLVIFNAWPISFSLLHFVQSQPMLMPFLLCTFTFTSLHITLFLGRLRPIKWLTSTWRAHSGGNWQLPLGYNGRNHNISVCPAASKEMRH